MTDFSPNRLFYTTRNLTLIVVVLLSDRCYNLLNRIGTTTPTSFSTYYVFCLESGV